MRLWVNCQSQHWLNPYLRSTRDNYKLRRNSCDKNSGCYSEGRPSRSSQARVRRVSMGIVIVLDFSYARNIWCPTVEPRGPYRFEQQHYEPKGGISLWQEVTTLGWTSVTSRRVVSPNVLFETVPEIYELGSKRTTSIALVKHAKLIFQVNSWPIMGGLRLPYEGLGWNKKWSERKPLNIWGWW